MFELFRAQLWCSGDGKRRPRRRVSMEGENAEIVISIGSLNSHDKGEDIERLYCGHAVLC
jgi:hypothetical protein